VHHAAKLLPRKDCGSLAWSRPAGDEHCRQ
jgi:hypothetical protein